MARLTLAQINQRIHAVAPEVTLHKDRGYHYYVFDDGKHYETESSMICHTSQLSADEWISDGIAYGERTQRKIEEFPVYTGGPFALFSSRSNG